MADFRLPLSGVSTHKSVNPQKLTLTNTSSGNVEYDGSAAKSVDLAALTVSRASISNNGVFFVKGTLTAATNAWTGSLPQVSSLYDGLTIAYYLPFAGTGTAATLQLTLANNIATAAEPVFYANNTRLTTHYGLYSIIHLTWISNATSGLAAVGSATGRWTRTNYDSNTVPSAICTTGAATAAKSASCSNYALMSQSYIMLILANANTATGALTLNINGRGAKPIYINGVASSSTNYTLPAGSYMTYYDGTNYHIRTDGILPGKILSAGTADIATKLAAAKTIAISGGATGTATSFDGSSNITIPVTALDVSKANAGTLAIARGGTNLTSYTKGDLIYASAANTLAKLAIGTSDYLLAVTSGLPAWKKPADITVGTATKLGTATVGSAHLPIWLENGVPKTANYTVAHRGNASKTNMNDVGRLHASVGMTKLSDPSNLTDNPMNGDTKSTGWHLYWDASYTDDPNGTNAWVALIANKAGTAKWWVRSRSGGTITNGTEWASGWRLLVTADQAGVGKASLPVYVKNDGTVATITSYEGTAAKATADANGLTIHTNYIKKIASSTDNAVVRWDGTGGQIVLNSGVIIDDNNNITAEILYANLNNAQAYPNGKTTNPWHLVAKYELAHNILLNTKIVFLITNYFSTEMSGILEVSCRGESNGAEVSWLRNLWMVCLGITAADFVATWAIENDKWILRLYVKRSGWTSYNLVRLQEHSWGEAKKVWQLLKAYNAGDNTFTEIPNTETQVVSSFNTLKNNISGNAATATTAGKWSSARTLTIGNKGQSVDGSANVSWALLDVLIRAGNEFNYTADGKESLWFNYKTQTGTSATTQIKSYSFGNGQGGTTGVTVYAATFNGALTGNVTGNVTGNATTSNGFAAAKTITLTGDTTGSGNGGTTSAGWSIATSTKYITTLGRLSSANINPWDNVYKSKLCTILASSSMTTGKPAGDGYILSFGWDTTAGWGAQYAMGHGEHPYVQVRGAKSTADKTTVWGTWDTIPIIVDARTKGNATTPVYIDSNGQITACTAYGSATVAAADHLTSSAGAVYNPIYFSNGKPTASKISFKHYLNGTEKTTENFEFVRRDFTKSITFNGDWQDLGITGTDLESGTWIILLYDDTRTSGAQIRYLTYWSGIMSWYSGGVNGGGAADEIILHCGSHSESSNHYHLRTIVPNLTATMKLLIKCSTSAAKTAANSLTLRFFRVLPSI